MDKTYYIENSKHRLFVNLFLLSVAISAFFILVSRNSEYILQKIVLVQLVLSVPLLLSSTLSQCKIASGETGKMWLRFTWITFCFGYAFITNVIGVFVGNIAGVGLSLTFFITSWLLALTYSLIEVSYRRARLKERLAKDLLFILLQLFFGVFVVLKIF